MFTHLTDLQYQRTAKQALGFYLAYFVLFLLIAGIVGALVALSSTQQQNIVELSTRMGILTAVIACTALGLLIVYKKHLVGHFPSLLIAVASGVCALFGGALLGLLPVAYLTTRPMSGAVAHA
jgi:ABC-type dipeptide/oligopeptide/nickel transport system permease subunit